LTSGQEIEYEGEGKSRLIVSNYGCMLTPGVGECKPDIPRGIWLHIVIQFVKSEDLELLFDQSVGFQEPDLLYNQQAQCPP
jgi:hypothetical protein